MEQLIKLDLAAGQNKKGPDWIGVDIAVGVSDIQQNLLKFPWQWGDSTVDEIHCSHFIEHIQMNDLSDGSKDLLAAFIDECYRILKPGATMTIICPSCRSNRAFWDFTHRRFLCSESFLYFSKEWRDLNKLDHYNINCNFGVNVGHSVPAEMNLLSPDASARRFNESWNVVFDCIATMKSLKPAAK